MAAASSTDVQAQHKAFERLRALSQCSLMSTTAQARDILKLANLVFDMLRQVVSDELSKVGDLPCLQVYSGDGTPVSLAKKVKLRLFGKKTHRQGRNTDEYYIQTAFFRFVDNEGMHHTCS